MMSMRSSIWSDNSRRSKVYMVPGHQSEGSQIIAHGLD